jgi:O-antigen/teichoic acid export membrane protein
MESSQERKKIFAGFFWKFSERISGQLISFVISVVLARILMPEDYGAVAMVQLFIIFANVFINSGLATSLIQKKDADDLDFSTIFYCSVVLSVFLYGITYFAAPLVSTFFKLDTLTPIIRIYGLILFLNAFNSIQSAYASRHMLFKKFFISSLGSSLLSGVIGIVMAYEGFGVWALVFQAISSTFFNMLILNYTIKWRPKLLFSWERAKKLLNYGWKILCADFIGTVFNELRQIIIGRFFLPADLAYYNRGKHFAQLIAHNVDSTMSAVLFPAMANHSDNPQQIKAMTRRAISTSSYVLYFCMFSLAVVAEPLIKILLTDKWIAAAFYLQMVCIAHLFGSISITNIQALKAIGRSDAVLKLEIIKKPVYLLLVIAAIPFGVKAIVITMPIYSLYALLVNMTPNKKILDYGRMEQIRDLAPATILSITTTAIVLPLSFVVANPYILLILQLTLFTSLYLGFSHIFKLEAYSYCKKLLLEKIKHHKEK